VGGNDAITGGDVFGQTTIWENNLYGDAYEMSDNAKGGDDIITGGADIDATGTYTNQFYGDAFSMSGAARGGDDRLIAGSAASDMWGDAALILDNAVGGNDVFVLSGVFGETRIHDFRQGEDLLEVDIDPSIDPFAQVTWTTVGSDTALTVTGPASSGSALLLNFTGLSGSDFHFV
jgi:hypothetical protein